MAQRLAGSGSVVSARAAGALLLALATSSGCSELGSDDRTTSSASFALLTDAGDADVLADATLEAGHQHPAPSLDASILEPHEPDESDAGSAGEPDSGASEPDPASEHCSGMHMVADPRDATLDPTPVILTVGRSQDVALPQAIVDWIVEQGWEPAHDAWHTTRSWDARCGNSFAPAEGCPYAEDLLADELFRARYQQGAPGAGLAFLHMHRHMIAMFKAAFPAHTDLFRGFGRVPRTQDDPENPTPWRALRWTANNLTGFDILENIEGHLDMFPNDDELGRFIETNLRWSLEDPAFDAEIPGSGAHGALHRQWSVFGSPASLGGPSTSLRNYTFWKLHGFIDDVWTRYRAAKGSGDAEPSHREAALYECVLMYYLVPSRRSSAPDSVRN